MATPEEPVYERKYVMDAESATEMARLRKQDELVTRGMGGLLSEQADLSSIQDVLDVACGPGGWALGVASTYPHMQVTGVDLSRTMLEFGHSLAVEQGLSNARFRPQNIYERFHFEDGTFDLVNGRYLAGILTPQMWPKVVSEMVRVARPGGIIRLTEPELGMTNDAAIEELNYLLAKALVKSGQSFSPDGRHISITAVLPSFLREAGLQNVQLKAHVTEVSVNGPNYADALQNMMVTFKSVQPYLIRMGMITQERLDRLYEQAVEGMQSASFCGLGFMLTVWGRVPF